MILLLKNIKQTNNKEKKMSKQKVYEEVLNFLVKNKSSWTIENEQIVFNTDEQVNEYNKLISKIG